MELSSQSPNGAKPRAGFRHAVATLMLGVVGGTCLILDAMANLEPVQEWLRTVAWQQAKWKKQIPLFCCNKHFIDYEDWLLHKEIPSADFSQGGVFIYGGIQHEMGPQVVGLPSGDPPAHP